MRKSHGSWIDFIKIIGIGLTRIVGQGAGAQSNEGNRQIGFLLHGPQQRVANAAVTGVVGGGHMAKFVGQKLLAVGHVATEKHPVVHFWLSLEAPLLDRHRAIKISFLV